MTSTIGGAGLSAASPSGERAVRPQTSPVRQWLSYLGGRFAGVIWVVVALVILTFAIVRLVPGNPARNIAGVSADQAQVDTIRARLGLDQGILEQAWSYGTGLVQGDLGESFRTQQPVVEMLAQRLPVTATLALLGLLVVLVIGFPLGIGMGLAQQSGRGRRRGAAFTVLTSFVGAIPEYILGTLLVLVFSLSLGWLPVQGGGSWAGMVMPAVSIGMAAGAVMARIVRNETKAVLDQEYISAARAKRINTRRLVVRHVLPNVVTSTLTMSGLLLVALLGGTVIAENVFNVPGLGTEIVTAILGSDYPEIQGIILVLGILAALLNLGIDIVLGILDPRVLPSKASR